MQNLFIASALTTIVLLFVPLAGCGKSKAKSSSIKSSDSIKSSEGALPDDPSCNYYASPSGGGNGLSRSSPFQISDFWSQASPGTMLCLVEGIYTGEDSMIDASGATGGQSVQGTSGSPITIKALSEGKTLIDGEGVRTPILIRNNDWFVVQGVNARNGNNNPNDSGSVVQINSDNVIVRRVVAWDAGDTNEAIVGVHGSQDVLLEDVAAFGIGRKVFESSQEGNGTTCRRCWGRWEGSHFIGPKDTFTLTYNNYDMTIENAIGAWSGEKMLETYTLKCTTGDTAPLCGQVFTNFDVDQPAGIFSQDRNDDPSRQDARSQILGSIAYLESGDRFPADALIVLGTSSVSSIGLFNTVAFIEPGVQSTTNLILNTFQLNNGPGLNFATGLTSVGGDGMTISSLPWQTSQIDQGQTVAGVGSIFTGASGANVCKRYKDRVLTNEPLWPWPMDQRIYDAMEQAGRTPFYVTQKIESMFGPIPSACKSAN